MVGFRLCKIPLAFPVRAVVDDTDRWQLFGDERKRPPARALEVSPPRGKILELCSIRPWGTPMKHTKITEELDALRGEGMVMGLKEVNIHEQVDDVSTCLVMVESLEKQLDVVEVSVEKKIEARTNIFSLLKKV